MSDNQSADDRVTSRRALVGGVLGVGIAVPLLVACGSDSESDSGSSGDSGGDANSDSTPDSGQSTGGGTTTTDSLGKTSEIPVGGAKIYKSEKVVVSQPTAGDFKAFSSICTHQQCPITKLDGDQIECTCHGSRFSVADGSVTQAPATKSLPALKVTVTGDSFSVS